LYNAGLEGGDEILKWDGKTLSSTDEFREWLSKHRPGDTVTLTVKKRAGEQQARVVLAQDPTFELISFEKAGLPVSDSIASFRRDWLASKALHPLPKIETMQ
jgi:PDZ domain-containing secreted protein